MNELDTYIISEFPRNEEETVRLGLKAYKGKVYFDLRIWFPDKETFELIPSKKGICLNLDYLPQMRGFMETLETAKTKLPEGFGGEEPAVQRERQVAAAVKTKGPFQAAKTKREERSTGPSNPLHVIFEPVEYSITGLNSCVSRRCRREKQKI